MKDLENFYNEIFSPKYLLKYGYYAYKKNRDKDTENDDYFNNESFYKMFNFSACSEIAPLILTQPYDSKTVTEPIYFSIPKKNLVRRQYKLPNLYSYTNLAKFMYDNKDEFINIFLNNSFSTSKFFDSPKYKFSTTDEIKQKLLHSGDKQLHIDLSNFYHTLYTHSIPWMIIGKPYAKANKANINIFANKLDRLIEACQYGETHGIPTGNLASRIIAELYMCHLDKKMESKGFRYARYVDDFTFSYTTDLEKEEFLENINLLCREHNLYINAEKTVVEKFPLKNSKSKAQIFNYFNNHKFTNQKSSVQRSIISDYIDLCISEESQGNKGALKIIFSGLQKNIVFDSVLSQDKIDDLFIYVNPKTKTCLLEKLLDISMKKTELTNRFMDLFEHLFVQKQSRKGAKQIIQNYFNESCLKLKNKLSYYKKNKFNQEIYQILLYIVQFDINTVKFLKRKEILEIIDETIDDFSLCLLTIIYLKRKLDINLLLDKINQLFEKTHSNYANQSRFSEKFWYFRYFIYFLIKNNLILKKDVNCFLNSKSYHSGKTGIRSELNSDFILTQGSQLNINKFYKTLLDLNIGFVDCGKNNNFKYF
ncbi:MULTISPECIES: RNA-directed DNA polymerase [unclassified Enterococcus]|uniref:RNA-directed DNA polymerase n=1 Tax=unclassified Enterococcus TaxID=2608891 RepID=UPI001554E872|nr:MULTISPECIES: RNA-directed DNA polymerase [unclassified Enterococcus]MBS7576100.1 RNA-directed DNA polymerase [Enterococcus sp. MMGLQ5-2]MBS7583333.1 RNA-directed DNA polymerase [Enterococcus sp. MMGLQ5-1]NPD11193.1 RNA-directed DNA polymerase [Enterococcus sp. MMGLQ5-1]NPD35936.1 RNA-directed DNA polymerase [Enterococcus sp. MMGLQ5-2]